MCVIGLIIKIRNWIPVNYHHHHVLKYIVEIKIRTVKSNLMEGRWRRKQVEFSEFGRYMVHLKGTLCIKKGKRRLGVRGSASLVSWHRKQSLL